jgi:hypothetical protein
MWSRAAGDHRVRATASNGGRYGSDEMRYRVKL